MTLSTDLVFLTNEKEYVYSANSVVNDELRKGQRAPFDFRDW